MEDEGSTPLAPPFHGLSQAVAALQLPSASLDQKIVALRYLKFHVSTTPTLDERTRSNINQLVLDHVLSVVLSEDRTVDLRRRQLLRTECFLMLASLLNSRTLFRGIDEKLVALAAAQQEQQRAPAQSSSSSSSSPNSSSTQPSGEYKQTTVPGDDGSVDYDNDGAFLETFKSDFGFPQAARPKPSTQPPPGWVRSLHNKDNGNYGKVNSSSSSSNDNISSPQAQGPGSPSRVTAYPSPSPVSRRPPPHPAEAMGVHPYPHPSHSHSPSPGRGGKQLSPTHSHDDIDVSLMSASAASSWDEDRALPRRPQGALQGSKSTTDVVQELALIRPLIAKPPRYLLRDKRLRPRPSVFFDGEYEPDGFVPGVDPTNWQEQDRRLGYQKPRMWFPVAGVGVGRKMVPLERGQGAGGFKPDRVVQEYMQMKALLSYVGDLVMPFQGKALTRTAAGAAVVARDGAAARPLARLTGVVDAGTYESAMAEAVQVWTPLVGAHLPAWAKNPADTYGAQQSSSDDASLESLGNQSLSSSSLSSAYSSSTQTDFRSKRPRDALQRAVLVSQEALRRLLKKEIAGSQRTAGTLRSTLQLLSQSDRAGQGGVGRRAVEGQQGLLTESLEEERHTVEQTMAAIQTLTRETIRMQYASLPARYLLLVEGDKANPRACIAKLIAIYCRARRANMLGMAFGVWKIRLYEVARQGRAVQYAKSAAVFLLREWVINKKFRQMRKWTLRWQGCVRRMIFEQRNQHVLPIQTLYRRWRDRCIIIRLHLQGPYNGPLSDIYLGPWRIGVKFRLPKSVRSSRRMYWQAAIQIQTRFRLFYLYRATRERRKKVILLQSVIRMWPKRMQFLRLRMWTIKTQAWMRRTLLVKIYQKKKLRARVIQKYVRRYLGQLWKWRELFKRWIVPERRLGAAILIQTRWREYWARKRVRRIIHYRKRRDWAGLILQRQWYKQKRQYHTFVLMCALRASEEIEEEFLRLCRNLQRFHCARIIQRVYAMRFFRRNLTSAIRLQCWWRGRLGYSLVDLRRKQLWASRKLHHWARGALRRKNARVRKIQRTWWKYKRGALLQHLAWRARLQDERRDRITFARRYAAAVRLQALVHGLWARYWVKRHRAALKIQPPLRYFLARQRRKRLKKAQNHSRVHKFVVALTARLLQRRVRQILKVHSNNMVKPQALVRRFLVLRRFLHAREAAMRYGRAVVAIQRCYRKSGAVAQAVARVLAARRADTNPFRKCSTLHALLLQLRERCNKLFNYLDPRAGLRVQPFLFRLGLADLIPMFPKKDFSTLQDLKNVKMAHLLELHDEWMERLDKEMRRSGNRDGGHKKKPKPTAQLQLVLDTIKPPLVPRAARDRALVESITSLQEVTSPEACGEMVYDKFLRKFGEAMVARAHNWSEKIVRTAWVNFNNYQTLGPVTTLRLIHRCLDDCSNGADVAPRMEELRACYAESAEDVKWDKRRVAEAAALLQLAFERATVILAETPPPVVLESDDPELAAAPPPEDPVARLLERAGHRVAAFRRKFGFMRDRLLEEKKREAKEAAKNPNRVVRPPVREPHWSLPESARSRVLTVDESIELPFFGETNQLDLEFNLSVVKVYQQCFDRLTCASQGVQGIKAIWQSNGVRRAAKLERARIFLLQKNEEYKHMVTGDHVKPVWQNFKRKEAGVKKFLEAVRLGQERRALVDGLLKWVPRFGWAERTDGQGYPYWVDLSGKHDSQVEMPAYTHAHWEAVSVLQRRTQAFFERLRERKRLKEEEKVRQMALIEEQWVANLKSGARSVKVVLVEVSNDVAGMVARARRLQQEEDVSSVASLTLSVAAESTAGEAGEAGGAEGGEGKEGEEGEEEAPDKSSSAREDDGDGDEAAEAVEGASPPSKPADRPDLPGAADAAPFDAPSPALAAAPNLVRQGSPPDTAPALSEAEIEASLPWNLRFASSPRFCTGMWALLKTPYQPPRPAGLYAYPALSQEDYGIRALLKSRTASRKKRGDKGGSRPSTRDDKGGQQGKGDRPGSRPLGAAQVLPGGPAPSPGPPNPYLAVSGAFSYEVVVVFRLRSLRGGKNGDEGAAVCDCKTVKGVRHTEVPLSRLCLINLDKGQRVEARHKGRKAFYRGAVLNASQDHLLRPIYSIKYDDGEIEGGVGQEMIRPSADALQAWFQQRNAVQQESVLSLRRRAHFLRLRAHRLACLEGAAEQAERRFALHWMWASGARPDPSFRPSEACVEQHAAEVAEAARAAQEAAEEQRRRGRRAPAPGPPSRGLLDPPPPSVVAHGLGESASSIQVLERGIKVTLALSRMPLKHGWAVLRGEAAMEAAAAGASEELHFVHAGSGETTTKPPIYRYTDDYYARKLQGLWWLRKARKRFRQVLQAQSLEDIAASAINRSRRVCFVGHEDEGVTVMQMVRRAGFSDVAAAIETKLKLYPKELAALTMESLVDLKSDRFESVGCAGAELSKSLKSLQKWWKGTTPMTRDKALKFINWFTSSADDRSPRAMLQTCEDVVSERLCRQFPQSTVRAQEAAKRVAQTLFPITGAMLESYLRKYGDKIDTATKDNLAELISRATTHTWREERAAYDIMAVAVRRIGVVLGNLKIRSVRACIAAAEARAGAVMAMARGGVGGGPATGRVACPGWEGRAAHILRVEALGYMQAVMCALRLIQRRARGFAKKSRLRRIIVARRRAIALMQRFLRGSMARAEASKLRLEQQAEWEQMWDADREIIYFYSNRTGKSSYLQPRGAYRPLIRDRRSQALMQAWPVLDHRRGLGMPTKAVSAVQGLDGEHASVAPQLAFCAVCHVRKCVRLCQGCVLPVVGEEALRVAARRGRREDRPMPYCFPCFTQAHGENTAIAEHAFTLATQGPEAEMFLQCVICDEPATRKCMGILDDGQIDDLCARLGRTSPKLWPDLLTAANVGGERKLAIILHDVLDSRTLAGLGGGGSESGSTGGDGDGDAADDASAGQASRAGSHATGHRGALGRVGDEVQLTSTQMQKVRQALERTRAECDESYCADCYKEVHAGGKRSMHRWIGFEASCPVCVVCTRSPAEEACRDCAAGYCSTCFKVFHATGRKRKHKHDKVGPEFLPPPLSRSPALPHSLYLSLAFPPPRFKLTQPPPHGDPTQHFHSLPRRCAPASSQARSSARAASAAPPVTSVPTSRARRTRKAGRAAPRASTPQPSKGVTTITSKTAPAWRWTRTRAATALAKRVSSACTSPPATQPWPCFRPPERSRRPPRKPRARPGTRLAPCSPRCSCRSCSRSAWPARSRRTKSACSAATSTAARRGWATRVVSPSTTPRDAGPSTRACLSTLSSPPSFPEARRRGPARRLRDRPEHGWAAGPMHERCPISRTALCFLVRT